jgi:hypothetical protein
MKHTGEAEPENCGPSGSGRCTEWGKSDKETNMKERLIPTAGVAGNLGEGGAKVCNPAQRGEYTMANVDQHRLADPSESAFQMESLEGLIPAHNGIDQLPSRLRRVCVEARK